jgi:hypothetical protein
MFQKRDPEAGLFQRFGFGWRACAVLSIHGGLLYLLYLWDLRKVQIFYYCFCG